MNTQNTVYVNISGCNNGIMKIIANDIVQELKKMGVDCSCGSYSEYSNQSIAYHMWWRGAIPYSDANINAVFITHTDDKLKEHDLVSLKGEFDYYITMSEEDAVFLRELGFDSSKVVGITLPVRNNYIRPISLGIFSNCYSDNRKNEQWLLDFCRNNEDCRFLNFVFIGDGWGDFVTELQKTGCSFEWHCVSKNMPYEYMFQQNKLSSLDYYIYMGMDGGAMGTYDAYAQGVELVVSDDGYHKAIPILRNKFETHDEFICHIKRIAEEQRRKIEFFEHNSVSNYVSKLYSVLSNSFDCNNPDDFSKEISQSKFKSVTEKRRYNYFPINYQRIRQTISNWFFVSKEHKRRK